MSDGPYLCEYCGRGSVSKERCSHCGRDISDMVNQPLRFRPPAIGKLTLRIQDMSHASESWKALAGLWDWLERNTNLRLWPSQMAKFPPSGDVLELYASSIELNEVKEKLPGLFTFEFQELPWTKIPHLPKDNPGDS